MNTYPIQLNNSQEYIVIHYHNTSCFAPRCLLGTWDRSWTPSPNCKFYLKKKKNTINYQEQQKITIQTWSESKQQCWHSVNEQPGQIHRSCCQQSSRISTCSGRCRNGYIQIWIINNLWEFSIDVLFIMLLGLLRVYKVISCAVIVFSSICM